MLILDMSDYFQAIYVVMFIAIPVTLCCILNDLYFVYDRSFRLSYYPFTVSIICLQQCNGVLLHHTCVNSEVRCIHIFIGIVCYIDFEFILGLFITCLFQKYFFPYDHPPFFYPKRSRRFSCCGACIYVLIYIDYQ